MNKKYTKMLRDFIDLGIEKKKSKLLLILEELKNINEVFGKLIQVINNDTVIDENFLINAYREILVFGELSGNYDNQHKQIHILKINKQIQRMHKLEKENKKNNPNDILKQI